MKAVIYARYSSDSRGGGIPLGYLPGTDQKLVIDPVMAPPVREIFQRYADGEIVRTIVEDFNRRGLKTKIAAVCLAIAGICFYNLDIG